MVFDNMLMLTIFILLFFLFKVKLNNHAIEIFGTILPYFKKILISNLSKYVN